MFIKTDSTPNLDSLKFIPGVSVLSTADTKEFMNSKEATKSPLAKKLFKIDVRL
jgi:NFU1 iron-sulfur cluster scaffold homolog, mitochondrial